MKIDHIGYAVKRMDRAIDTFQKLGFQFEEITNDSDRNIQISFGIKDGYRIELVSPLEKEKQSPVDAYLSKIGPAPYHFCYISESFEEDINELQKLGHRIVINPAPAVAFGGKRVVFMMSLAAGLLEVVEG